MLTFASALSDLTDAGAFAADADTAKKKSILNQAVERILYSGRWVGTSTTINITVNSSGTLTLPRHFKTILGVKADDCSRSIASKWWSYANAVSTDLQKYEQNVQTQNSGYATFSDPTEPVTLKMSCVGNDGTVVIRGNDQNGAAVYDSAGALGFSLTLNDSAWSTTEVSSITSVQMPETSAVKTLSAHYADGTVEVIGIYEPSELGGDYTRYFVPEATLKNPDDLESDDVAITALVQRQFVKLVADSDPVHPSHIGGLKNACLAIHWEDESDPTRRTDAFNEAIRLLNDELKRSRGESELGQIRINCIGQQMGQGIHSQR